MIRMKKLIIFVGLILVLPFNVKAVTNSISVNCPSKANSGHEISCSVFGYSNVLVSSLSSKISVSSNLEFVSFAVNGWEGGYNAGKIDLYTSSNKSGDFSIGTINLRVKSSANSANNESVLAYENVFYDDNFDEMAVSNSSSTISITSTDNYLSSLSVGGYNIGFNKEKYSYSLEVESSSVTISATASDSKAKVSGTGTKNLSVGSNKFTIAVTSEAGNVRNYNIEIVRVKKDVINNDDNSDNMNPNKNDNNDKLSNNNNLRSLEIDGYDIVFKKDVLVYNIEVDSKVEEINVIALAEDSKSKVVVSGNKKFNYGRNVVLIQVTSESNKMKEYKIIVYRLSNEACLLKNLVVGGYDIKFEPNKFVYNIDIKDEVSLVIRAIPRENSAKVDISGNDNLKDGSIISIKVKNGDKEAVYKISIKKPGAMDLVTNNIKSNGSNNKENSNLIFIVLGLFVVIAIGVVTFFVIKKGKNKDNSDTTIDNNQDNTLENDVNVIKNVSMVTNNTIDLNKEIEEENKDNIND